MRYTHIHALLAIVAVTAMTSCSDDIDIPAGDITATHDMRFTATLEGSGSRASMDNISSLDVIPMAVKTTGDSMYLRQEVIDSWPVETSRSSRSNMVNSSGSGMYDRINLSAYYYTDAWSADKASYQPNYFYFEGAAGDMTSGYSLYNERYWPSTGKMRFLAFAPYDAGNALPYMMANVNESAGPYVHIEVDQDVTKHQDLLVAYTEGIDCSETHVPVNLNFKHALSCIQFVMGDDMETCRIKSITIKGVKYSGDFRFRDNMASEMASSTKDTNISDSYYPWDLYRDFTLDLTAVSADGVEVSKGDLVTDESHSFLMFPQIVPNGATVEIILQRMKADGTWNSEEEIYGYISGKHWPAGKILRYVISNEKWWQELQVSKLPAFTPLGGDQTFDITSYDLSENGEQTAIQWTATYEDPDNPGTFIDTKPAWYDFDTNNQGSVTPQAIKVTAQALPIDHTVDLNALLKSVGTYGSQSAPYNLSTGSVGSTTVGTTANCYIVDRPGWYIIPLVYGNGIVNGQANTTAYNPDTDTTNGALRNFINCQGNEIASPYILIDCSTLKSAVTTSSARVLWQDKPNLVRNSSITVDKSAFDGNGGIVFEITAGDIIQGNCVIGLDLPGADGQEMWSWHIWVTSFFRPGIDPLIGETISMTNREGNTLDMLYLNMGWCSEKPVEIYKERSSKVRFTATTSDGRTLTKDLDIVQAPLVKYWHGRNTYYQWGRKDPLPPFLKSYEESWYESNGTVHWSFPSSQKFGSGTTAMRDRILYPLVFHTSDDEQIGTTGRYKPINIDIYTNLWDATYSAKPVENVYNKDAIDPVVIPSRNNVKSVYDPCPAGYKVPPIDTFTGFTNTGNDIGELVDSPKNWNGMLMSYEYNCGGDPAITNPYVYLFYTNTDKTSYIAFPLTGYREWRQNADGTAGASYQMGNYGYSWTGGAANDVQSYYLELRKDPESAGGLGWIMPLDYFWQLDGLPVRPCHE